MIVKGTRVNTVNFGWCEAISDSYEVEGQSSRKGWVDVKFDNSGYVKKKVRADYFVQGCVRDSSIPVEIKVGQIYHTNLSGDVEVVGGDKNKNIQIKFLNTGSLYKVQKDAMLTGFCKDQPTISARIEKETKETKERVRVAKFKATVRKNTEAERKIESLLKKEARKQREKERQEYLALSRTERDSKNKELIQQALELDIIDLDQTTYSNGVLNIDFKDREGNWVLRYRDPTDKSFVQTRLGKLHNNVTQRCTAGGSVQNKFSDSYKGVTISEGFKDSNSFCDWAVKQIGWGYGYHLDKDLLIEGNRHYSEATCCFLPAIINMAINGKGTVSLYKGVGYYQAKSHINKNKIILGNYDTRDAAEQACRDFKQSRLSRLTECFKDFLDPRAYEKLLKLYS